MKNYKLLKYSLDKTMYFKAFYKLIIIVILGSNLFAQDIQSGIKLIKYEKYSAAKSYFASITNPALKSEAYFYLGQVYFITGNIDSAKIAYSEGLKADSDFPLNYAGLVKVNMYNGVTAEAVKISQQAIDVSDKDNPMLYVILSEAYSSPKVRNFDKAMEYLQIAMKSKKKIIDSYLRMGEVYIAKGNGTEAIRNYEEALNMDPINPEALTLKAKVYVLINQINEGLNLLNQTITNDPAYSPAYNELAEVYAGLKDYAKAAEYYAKYIDFSEVTLEKQKRYASILYIKKDYDKAIQILETTIASDPNSIPSIRILAYSYLRIDQMGNSKVYFEKLFSIDSVEYLPSDFENYADLLSKTGNDSLALDYYLKVVDLDSTRKDILGKMSVINFKNKNWNGVIYALERKSQLTAQEYFDLSKAYIFRGDAKIASIIQSLNSALTLDDLQKGKIRQELLIYINTMNTSTDEANKSTADEKFLKAVEELIDPKQKSDWNSAKSNWMKTVAEGVTRDFVSADSSLGNLISKSSSLAIAHLWRARVNSNFDPESEKGLAKPFYEEFIELAKPDADKYKKELIESYSYLGYYYYLQEDNTSSKTYWQEVLVLDPQNKQAIEVLKQLK